MCGDFMYEYTGEPGGNVRFLFLVQNFRDWNR